MGETRDPGPVKVFCGILHRPGAPVREAVARLAGKFGPPDMESPGMSFDFTGYYAPEMGRELTRFFVAFSGLHDPAFAADWKIFSNEIEKEFSHDPSLPSRSVNLDPGYLVPSRILLLTTKDFAHRVYLRNGIFAEVTLVWRRGAFAPMPWTYPDYATPLALEFFTRVRARVTTGSNLYRLTENS